MAVSLKKPLKVDLSKPHLPPRLRECTPVYLLDEEETIHNKLVKVDLSKPDLPSRVRGYTPVDLLDEEETVYISGEVLHRYHKFKDKRAVYSAFLALGIIAGGIVLFFLIRSLIDFLGSVVPEKFNGDIHDILYIFEAVLAHPIVIIGFVLSGFGAVARCLRNVSKGE